MTTTPPGAGKEFERICKWFLGNDPVYRRELKRVWLWEDWPGRWGADSGIDLVGEDIRGQLWAVQAKAYDPAYWVTKADVDTFLSASATAQFSFRLLIATTNRMGQTAVRTIREQEKKASVLMLAGLEDSQVEWPRTIGDLAPRALKAKRPLPHQREAIGAVVRSFGTSRRGQLVMACGTGKTLTAMFIAEKLRAERTLVLVPTLSLLAQTVREWSANGFDFAYLPVCSDDTVTEADASFSSTSDLGFPVTTDPAEIASFLRAHGSRRVVFATYQSSPRVADAYRAGRVPKFELVVADEAHRCAPRRGTSPPSLMTRRSRLTTGCS